MRNENVVMKNFLAANEIKCSVKYLSSGSLQGTWRLYGKEQRWGPSKASQLTSLGFRDFDGKYLDAYSGNGGMFSVFVRAAYGRAKEAELAALRGVK